MMLAYRREPHDEIAVSFRAVASESAGDGFFDVVTNMLVRLRENPVDSCVDQCQRPIYSLTESRLSPDPVSDSHKRQY